MKSLAIAARVDKYVDYKIPRILHQTFKYKITDNKLLGIIDKNLTGNPELEYRFYDDDDCETFIKKHCSKQQYTAYMAINPKYGAAKADFFRYVVIYVIGGVYLDVKSSIFPGLFDHIKKDDICILDEPIRMQSWRQLYPTFEQWLLIAAPGHLYFKRIIEKITRDVLSTDSISMKLFPSDLSNESKQMVMRLTGPDALAVSIHDVVITIGTLHRTINYDKIADLGGLKRGFYTTNNVHYSKVKDYFSTKNKLYFPNDNKDDQSPPPVKPTINYIFISMAVITIILIIGFIIMTCFMCKFKNAQIGNL